MQQPPHHDGSSDHEEEDPMAIDTSPITVPEVGIALGVGKLAFASVLRWVSGISRARPRQDLADALIAISFARGDASLPDLQQMFLNYCFNDPAALTTWSERLSVREEEEEQRVSEDAEMDALRDLREMYWVDNPDRRLLETKGYLQIKYYIEHVLGFFKLMNPVGYGFIEDKERDVKFRTGAQMRDFLQDMYYYTSAAQGDGSMGIEKACIAEVWLKDDQKRHYIRIVVDPDYKHAPDELNMWPGFAAEKLPPVPDADVEELVRPILKHIHDILSAGEADCYQYILDWMTYLVISPRLRTQTMLLFYGRQGAGKGIIWDFIRKRVLGPPITLQTDKPETDFFSKFANGFLYKRLVQLDELKNIHEHEASIKNLLTCETLRYEAKGKDAITVDNITNFVVTTNLQTTVKVAADDRRLVLVQCSDDRAGDVEYFRALSAELARPEVARAFYQFCFKRNMEDYLSGTKTFQHNRPLTKFYRDSRAMGLSLEIRLLNAVVNHYEGSVLEISGSKFYANYTAFVESDTGGKSWLANNAFGKFINSFEAAIVRSKKVNGTQYYKIDTDKLKEELTKRRSRDEDSSFGGLTDCTVLQRGRSLATA